MRNTVLVLLLVLPLGVFPAGADGMLDPSFGDGGLVVTGFPPPPPPFSASELVASLLVLPDGRVVAAGRASTEPTTPGMGVARYLPSGALDTTFSDDGLVRIECQGFGAGNGGVAVLLQPDGRLIVVSTCPPWQFTVRRLNVDGSLDTSFGAGGEVFTSFPSFTSLAVTGLLQPDGRIVAVGQGVPMVGGPAAVMAVRYNADGSLDSSFGTAGQLILTLADSFLVRGAALQQDGKVVIPGTYGPASSTDFGLVRLLPNGTADPSFDGDGLATANVTGTDVGYSVVVLPDGRHVVAGSHDGDFALVRFLPDGSWDTTFGTGGLATASFGAPVTPDEAVQLPNGKLMLAGSTNDAGAAGDFLLARFHADGPLDASFGNAGFLRTDINALPNACQAIAIAGPDLILAAGASCQPFNCDFTLARYIATTPVELLAFEVE
jgi:uncharacterized delta-60 repeat protein